MKKDNIYSVDTISSVSIPVLADRKNHFRFIVDSQWRALLIYIPKNIAWLKEFLYHNRWRNEGIYWFALEIVDDDYLYLYIYSNKARYIALKRTIKTSNISASHSFRPLLFIECLPPADILFEQEFAHSCLSFLLEEGFDRATRHSYLVYIFLLLTKAIKEACLDNTSGAIAVLNCATSASLHSGIYILPYRAPAYSDIDLEEFVTDVWRELERGAPDRLAEMYDLLKQEISTRRHAITYMADGNRANWNYLLRFQLALGIYIKNPVELIGNCIIKYHVD